LKPGREEGRMWVFTRPRGGQDYYLLIGEIRAGLDLCPIHRFDGMDQVPKSCRSISLIEASRKRAKRIDHFGDLFFGDAVIREC